jgi:hypothetical protein
MALAAAKIRDLLTLSATATDGLTQRLRHINPGAPVWRGAEDDLGRRPRLGGGRTQL